MATSLTYEGPPAQIVELEREVNYGDVLLDIDDGLAAKLLKAQGLREAKSSEIKKAKGEAEAPPPSEEEGGEGGGF